jgi:predicted ATPase/DNA-binding SARP family transcriptional activator
MLEIRTLGGISLGVNGKTITDMGSRKAEAMVVYLAVEGRLLNRDVLAALFWPESTQDHASTSMRVALSILRKNLGNYLDISRDTVEIQPDAKVYLDLTDLEEKLACGNLDQALEIYRGDFLQGFHIRDSSEFEDWLRWEQARLRRSVISALHASISDAILATNYDKGHSFVMRLLELDPLDELAHQQCMLLLARDGQRAAAIIQYEQFCAILQEELGIAPSAETQSLYEQILHGEKPADLGPAVPEHNLPTQQTSFIGREKELAQIGGLIRDPACRLLTLVGPGGSGKTRLALRAVTNALRLFPDGTYFIPLDATYSADYLIPSIAKVLKFNIDNFASPLDPKIQLIDYLRNRSILLVLDGFEHLIGDARFVSEMLDQVPNLFLLVTSRQRLGLKGEWTYLVEGLPVPQNLEPEPLGDSDALRLFTERAQQAKTDFQFTATDYEHGARICQLVEGMPLGIELSSAWISILSPKEIAQEMEKGFDFLTTSMHDIPEKHSSLQSVFDSSWLLLTGEQRELFSKLSVFKGGFGLQAAAQVIGANLQQLSALMDKSMLRRNEEGYFSIHNLLQQFAAEKLGQQPEVYEHVHNQHCRYYISLLNQREADIMGSRMLQARKIILREMENIRAALNWASLHWEGHLVRQALIAWLCFYAVRDWHEGQIAFRDIAQTRREILFKGDLPAASQDQVILSARIHQSFLLTNLGQIDESESISRECLEALGELGLSRELSVCLHNLGVNDSFRGEYESAMEYLEEAILLGRESDHILWPTYLLWLGHVYFLLGEYEQGLLSLQKCYDIFDRKGTLWGAAFALSKMGLAADGLGEHSQAMQYHRQALSISERVSNQAIKGYALSRMSMSAYFLEDYPQALQFGQEGYQVFKKIDHRWGLCTSLCRLGFAYIGLRRIRKAKEYFTDALRQSKQAQMLPLSLYALAGLASTLALEGEKRTAVELFAYVKQHPQTPTIFLDQAVRWMEDIDQASLGDGRSVVIQGDRIEAIDQLVERLVS